jgi:hypothetical protein
MSQPVTGKVITNFDNFVYHINDIGRARVALVVGAIIMIAFIFEDLLFVPYVMFDTYLINRLGFQIPLIILTFALTFCRTYGGYR